MYVWDMFLKSLQTLLDVHPIYVVSAIALYVVGVIIGGARWKKILSGLGCPSRLVDTSLVVLIGIFVNNITPGGRMGGEIARIALIRRRARIDAKKAVASVVYDRLVMVLPLVLLMTLSFPVIHQQLQRFNSYVVISALITSISIGLFVGARQSRRIREWMMRQREHLASVCIDRSHLVAAIGYSTLVWIQDLLRLMIVAAAFGVMLTPHQAATLSLVSLFCSFIPSLGGLGPTEGGLTATLHFFGVNMEIALAITMMERAISYVLSTGAGCFALSYFGIVKVLRQVKPIPEGT